MIGERFEKRSYVRTNTTRNNFEPEIFLVFNTFVVHNAKKYPRFAFKRNLEDSEDEDSHGTDARFEPLQRRRFR